MDLTNASAIVTGGAGGFGSVASLGSVDLCVATS